MNVHTTIYQVGLERSARLPRVFPAIWKEANAPQRLRFRTSDNGLVTISCTQVTPTAKAVALLLQSLMVLLLMLLLPMMSTHSLYYCSSCHICVTATMLRLSILPSSTAAHYAHCCNHCPNCCLLLSTCHYILLICNTRIYNNYMPNNASHGIIYNTG